MFFAVARMKNLPLVCRGSSPSIIYLSQWFLNHAVLATLPKVVRFNITFFYCTGFELLLIENEIVHKLFWLLDLFIYLFIPGIRVLTISLVSYHYTTSTYTV